MNLLEKLVNKKNKSKLFRINLHIIFWFFYWLIGYYFNTISFNIFSSTILSWTEPLCNVLNLLFFYYPLMYLIWPNYLRKKKYLIGILFIFFQILIYTVFYEFQERLLLANCPSCVDILAKMPSSVKQGTEVPLFEGIAGSLYSLGILYVLIARLSPVIAIKVSLDFIQERTAAIELEKENILLEFNFLKSQVNPHFLFNTLNNIHSLVVQDRRQDASSVLAKLSDFLRHSLYESGVESISLSKEVKLLEDYIELEKLRLNNTKVTLVTNTNNHEVQIPPLLFIPLVENAFKYIADNLPLNSFIDIKIDLNDKLLTFYIRNNYDPIKRNLSGGIGVKNLSKRLINYYPEKHYLKITDSDNIYEIKISIQL